MTRAKQEVYQRRGALWFSGSQLVGVEGSGFFRGSGLSYLFALGVVFLVWVPAHCCHLSFSD